MGQRMKLKINVFLSSLAFVILGASACVEKVKEKEGQLGKEASPQEVQNAIRNALDKTKFLGEANINEQVVYEDNIRIEQGAFLRTRLVYHTLINIIEEATRVRFVLTEDWWRFDYSSGAVTDEKHGEFEVPLERASPALNPAAISFNTLRLMGEKLVPKALDENLCDGADVVDENGLAYDCIKYFNLQTAHRQETPPTSVKNRPGCNGLPDCLMTIEFLQYDSVKWKNGQSLAKYTVTAEIALDVPDLMYEYVGNSLSYTPPVLSLCYKGLTPIDGSQYMVSQCTVLKDFQ